MPVQLVELAVAWGRRWSFGRHGPGCGPASVLGKGLAGPPARVLSWRRGPPRQRSRRGSLSYGPHLILRVHDLDNDLHVTTEVLPEPWFQCSRWRRLELLGSRVARSAGVGQVAPARLLPGPWRPARQGPCRGSPPCPSALCISGLGVASLLLRLWLSSPVLLSVAAGAALTARAQVKG